MFDVVITREGTVEARGIHEPKRGIMLELERIHAVDVWDSLDHWSEVYSSLDWDTVARFDVVRMWEGNPR